MNAPAACGFVDSGPFDGQLGVPTAAIREAARGRCDTIKGV